MTYVDIWGLSKMTYITAEMFAKHADGIYSAKEIIHAAKEADADCITLQTYTLG